MTEKKQKRVLVIAGPTGVGESTITKRIMHDFPVFKRLVTATTRAPRLKEKNKIDYYFFSKDEFKDEIKKENILEYTYIESRDVYYGSYKPDLEEKINNGYNVIVNMDIVGAKFYKENYNATTIFIMPGSIEDLKKRHLTRDPNLQKEELEKRLKYAKYEIEKESPFYEYIILNRQNKLEDTISKVKEILRKENYCNLS